METRAVLKTQRLVLRPFHPNDVDAVWAFNKTVQCSPYVKSAPQGYTRKNAEDFVAHAILQDSNLLAQFAITIGRRVIGSIGLKVEKPHGTAELEFSIGGEHQGKGIVLEASEAVLEYGFMVLGLSKVYVRSDGGNNGAAQVFAKLGMSQEGTLRSHRVRGGERVDEAVYGVLRSEWAERSQATALSAGEA